MLKDDKGLPYSLVIQAQQEIMALLEIMEIQGRLKIPPHLEIHGRLVLPDRQEKQDRLVLPGRPVLLDLPDQQDRLEILE